MNKKILGLILTLSLAVILIRCSTTTPTVEKEVSHHERVQELYESGKYTQAADTAAVLIEKYPEESKIFYYLGLAKFQLGDFEQGLSAYNSADTLAGGHTRMDSLYSVVLTEKAEQFHTDEDYELAMKWARQALEFNPYNQKARYEYHMCEGKQLFFQGSKWELWDAIVAFGKAEQAQPDNPMPYYYSAKSFHKKDDQDFENIISAYEKALSNNPPPELKKEIQSELEEVQRRKKLYEDFWGN